MKHTPFLLLASLLATQCLNQAYAGVPIASANPLYYFAHDASGNQLSEFGVDFDTLAKYYQFTAGSILKTNTNVTLQAKNTYAPLPITEGGLTFKVNLDTMTATPNQTIAPESAQALFSFDPKAFMAENPGKDFSDAQVNYFKKRSFDPKTQQYERTFLHLSDWKSLLHPPIRDVGATAQDQDFYLHTSHSVPTDSKLLTSDFNKQMDALTDSELTRGNTMKLLVNNTSFDEKMALVKSAKKSIYVGVMSFASDPTSFALIDAMIEKVKEGVEVQIMLEKLWTVTVFRNTMKRMTDGGIKLLLVDDMMTLNGKKRTLFHNKVWIFDDEIAIVGGQNIVNSSNSSSGFNNWNKDTDVRINGPMVTDILKEYTTLTERYDIPRPEKKEKRFNLKQGRSIEELRAVISAKKEKESIAGLRGTSNYQTWFSNPDTATTGTCRYVIQGPQKQNTILAKTYAEYFAQAKNELFLTSQHIEYNPEDITDSDDTDEQLASKEEKSDYATKMFQALFDTAKTGVNVNLIANGIDGGFAEIGENIAKGRENPKREAERQAHFARQIAEGKEPSTFMSRLSTKLGLKSAKKFRVFLDDAITHPNFNAWMHFQYIHSKTVMIDDFMSSIGSFNFEPYSSEHSHESAIFCYDRQLTHDLKADYIRDIVNSTPVLPEQKPDTSDNSTTQAAAQN